MNESVWESIHNPYGYNATNPENTFSIFLFPLHPVAHSLLGPICIIININILCCNVALIKKD